MNPALDVSVLLPTYCEKESLARLLPSLVEKLSGFQIEILIIDDGSPDGTAALVREFASHLPCRLIERGSRRGLATAIVDGFDEARGRCVVVMDADGSHPEATVPTLVAPILASSAEMVLGSRRAPGGSSPGIKTPQRRLIAWGARLLARPLTSVTDPMSGFFAIDRMILRRARLRPVGFKIGLEIIVRCRPSPLLEVPFRFAERRSGGSKLNRQGILDYVRHLRRLYAAVPAGPRVASSTR